MTRHTLRLIICSAALAALLALPAAPLAAQTGDPTPAPGATPAPTTAPPFRAVGDAFLDAGRPTQALEYYLKALEADPTDAAALDAVRRLLADRPDDPRVALAEAYADAGNYDAALALYAELLAAEQVDDAVREAALESVDQTRLLPALARTTGATAATGAAAGVVNFLLGLLGALLLIAALLLAVRVVRWWRGRKTPSGRTIAVLPFLNATGAESLAGMEHGARAAVVAWLVANSAAADGTPIAAAGDSVIIDAPDTVVAEPFPDVGGVGKFLNWVWRQTTPPRPALVVDGTLLYRAAAREVGLALNVRERPGGPVIRAWRVYAPASSQTEFAAVEKLAAQGASWIREPGLTLSPTRAVETFELNQRLVLARAQAAAGDKRAAQQTARAAPVRAVAGNGDGDGLESGGLAGGAAPPAADAGFSDALARHREAQLHAFLNDLSGRPAPEGG